MPLGMIALLLDWDHNLERHLDPEVEEVDPLVVVEAHQAEALRHSPVYTVRTASALDEVPFAAVIARLASSHAPLAQPAGDLLSEPLHELPARHPDSLYVCTKVLHSLAQFLDQ